VKGKIVYSKIKPIADRVIELLRPVCERIEIAGSIRRECPECGDIEIVAIPKPYNTGLFESGIATHVNRWRKIKGELPCKYTQRILPEKITLDLFFAEKNNWGLIYAIRTGSADYSYNVLATGWVKNGYKSENGYLTRGGRIYFTPEEKDLFEKAGVKWIEPKYRNL
jgi:DNA polymerase/3'-5' exonuclease PolX